MKTRAIIMLSFLGGAMLAAPASAQATRTWISGVGDDANPCSRTAPCKTFAGAISKTATNGEINCLDSGGFGGVTITKSIQLRCEGVVGGVLVAGTSGITINAGATGVVVISGLDLNGLYDSAASPNGINVLSAGAVHVRNTNIHGFRNGISFAPSGTASLYVTDSSIQNSKIVATTNGFGLVVQPSGAGSASVHLKNVKIENNGYGVYVNSSGVGASVGVNVNITDSVVSGNLNQGVYAYTVAGAGFANVTVMNSMVSGNLGYGLVSQNAGATIRSGASQISGNGGGVGSFSGGQVLSFGTNQLVGNGVDGAFTGSLALQ